MKLLLILITFIIYLDFILNNTVVAVNDYNYKEYINNHEYVAIFFHAPWSNDSKILRVQYLALPGYLNRASNNNIAILETNSKSREMIEKYEVKSFPTIVLVSKERFFHYKGTIKARDLNDWIDSKTVKKIKNINTIEDFKKALDNLDSFVIYTGDYDNIYDVYQQVYYKEFSKATEHFQDYLFYRLNNISMIENLNIDPSLKNLQPKLFIFKTYDDNLNIYSPQNLTDFTSVNIEKFIRAYYLPAINSFSSNNYIYAVNNRIEFTILVVNSDKALDLNEEINRENAPKLYKDFYIEAMKYRGEIFFMVANFSDLSQTTITSDYEFDENNLPIVVLNGYNTKKTRIERYTAQNGELENLANFYSQYKKKDLQRFLKSEELPTPTNKYAYYNVLKLVRKNFYEYVIHSKENFVLYIIKRNCGLCQEVFTFLKRIDSV